MRNSFSINNLSRANSSPLKLKGKRPNLSKNLSQKFKFIIHQKAKAADGSQTNRNSREKHFPELGLMKGASLMDLLEKKNSPRNKNKKKKDVSSNHLNVFKIGKNGTRPRLNSHNSDLRDINSNAVHPKNLITIFVISPNEQSGSLRKCLLVNKLQLYVVKQLKFFDEDISAIFRDFLKNWKKNVNDDPYMMHIEEIHWDYPEGCASVVMPNIYGYNLQVDFF